MVILRLDCCASMKALSCWREYSFVFYNKIKINQNEFKVILLQIFKAIIFRQDWNLQTTVYAVFYSIHNLSVKQTQNQDLALL